MAKISLILSIVVLFLTAGLGYVTKGKVEEKVQRLNAETTRANEQQAAATAAKTAQKKAEGELTAAQKTVEDQKGQITGLESDLTAAKGDAEKAKAVVTDQEMKIAQLNKDLEAAKSATPVVDPNTPNPAVAALQEKLVLAEKELAESKQVQATLNERQKANEQMLAEKESQIKRYQTPMMQQQLTGRVISVNPGWNFVVLDVGDRQGVTVNSPLVVYRGGQMVARLRVTSVEPRTAIADIVAASIPKGQYVQAGDRVVFAGNRGQQPLPAANPAPEGGGTTTPAASAPQAAAQ